MAKQTTVETLILFKAKGTFQGSKPTPNSPYPTATPFYSNGVLGQQIWPGDTPIESIHHRLSVSLNDRHSRIGIIGDWRDTHSPEYGGYWSYHIEKYRRIRTPGQKDRNEIIFEETRESN